MPENRPWTMNKVAFGHDQARLIFEDAGEALMRLKDLRGPVRCARCAACICRTRSGMLRRSHVC